MRTFIWKIVDFCYCGVVLAPFSTLIRYFLIMTCKPMKELDTLGVRTRLLLNGVLGASSLTLALMLGSPSPPLTLVLFSLYGFTIWEAYAVTDAWIDTLARAKSNELFGIPS